MEEFQINTKREGFYNITPTVMEAVRKSGIESGAVIVFCPHTTAGITINENADPDVQDDMLGELSRIYPNRSEFKHVEGNSYAHMKASAVGSSATVIVEDGRLVLGIWQGIYFCEFDGPRSRKYYVKVMEG